MHPPGLPQLPHPRVDEGDPRPSRLPRVQRLVIVLVGEVRELRPHRPPVEVGHMVGEVPRELPPVQLPHPRLPIRRPDIGEVRDGGEELPRRDLTEAQARRQRRRPLRITGHVPVLGVAVDALAEAVERLRGSDDPRCPVGGHGVRPPRKPVLVAGGRITGHGVEQAKVGDAGEEVGTVLPDAGETLGGRSARRLRLDDRQRRVDGDLPGGVPERGEDLVVLTRRGRRDLPRFDEQGAP